MLNFLPAFLLLFIILILFILQRMKMPVGTSWLILVLLTLVNWGSLLFLRSHLPEPLTIQNWFPVGVTQDAIVLRIDANSWYFLFAMGTLLVGMVLTSSAYLHEGDVHKNWFTNLIVFSAAAVALLADSPLAFVILWAMIDLLELIIFTVINREPNIGVHSYAIFFSRLLGLGMVITAMVVASREGASLELKNPSTAVLTLLVLGASLRLGVFPLHLPYTQEISQRRFLGTSLHILIPVTALTFLVKLPPPGQITTVIGVIWLFAVLGSLFGSINWFHSRNELEGRPYWMLSFSCLALIAYLSGSSSGVILWGFLMVAVGGWNFFAPTPFKRSNWLFPAALLLLCGLPFTPGAPALGGLSGKDSFAFGFLAWVVPAFLMAGIIRFSLKREVSEELPEKWMRLFHGIAAGILLLTPWLTVIFRIDGWNRLTGWWIALISLVLLGLICAFEYHPILSSKIQNWQNSAISSPFKKIGKLINRFLQFDWFYRFLEACFNLLKIVVNGLTGVLEGEGSILWALVFLALLVSILINQGFGIG